MSKDALAGTHGDVEKSEGNDITVFLDSGGKTRTNHRAKNRERCQPENALSARAAPPARVVSCFGSSRFHDRCSGEAKGLFDVFTRPKRSRKNLEDFARSAKEPNYMRRFRAGAEPALNWTLRSECVSGRGRRLEESDHLDSPPERLLRQGHRDRLDRRSRRLGHRGPGREERERYSAWRTSSYRRAR
jgi:hypothetical protein